MRELIIARVAYWLGVLALMMIFTVHAIDDGPWESSAATLLVVVALGWYVERGESSGRHAAPRLPVRKPTTGESLTALHEMVTREREPRIDVEYRDVYPKTEIHFEPEVSPYSQRPDPDATQTIPRPNMDDLGTFDPPARCKSQVEPETEVFPAVDPAERSPRKRWPDDEASL